MKNRLHIVCLDGPSPPNYGGAIDMFYKIQALAEKGKKIILHYFDYNPSRNTEGLETYCEAIYPYQRKSIITALPLSRPFIVQSRINRQLIERLNNDNDPILLEGLHCSGIVPFLNNRTRVVLRMHNEEAAYYQHLAKTEKSFLKRKYFAHEAKLLNGYQLKIDKHIKLACLSDTDRSTFKNDYGFINSHFVPCFIPWQSLSVKQGRGDYCLYHGNLAVSENEEAALWLLKNVFSKTREKLLIAGKGISARLQKESKAHSNVRLINNPSISQLNELIEEAHINVLPSMNSTGVKLKLLHAVINGRYCITNYNGVKGSCLEKAVTIANNPVDWILSVEQLMKLSIAADEIQKREIVLELYDNQKNAERLNALW